MTTHTNHRCSHCRIVYPFQRSGAGCDDPLNDSKYCPKCKEAVLTALQDVPKRCEQKWVLALRELSYAISSPEVARSIAERRPVTLDLVLEWKEQNRAEKEDGIFPVLHRVSSPLIDPETGESSIAGFVWGRDEWEGWYFRYMYWEDWEARKLSPPTIQVRTERNLETGQITNWRVTS